MSVTPIGFDSLFLLRITLRITFITYVIYLVTEL